jgi:DNA invertase Pin-like site-specific DNA recombinase
MSTHDPARGVADKGAQQSTFPKAVVRPLGLRSLKIQKEHLDRLAVVYVRQSSQQQVLEHQESRARQYALADHAQVLGWAKERVLLIDEDQGQSGKSAEQRSGFQRLLSELALDHVGMILGLEMSRLARSSKDWHSLLEVCGVFGTLLADQDGVYDPNDSNDRLLLGLKGTMSEVELTTMRNRLYRGKLNKAQRGELFHGVPPGYWKLPSGQVEIEPDEQARAVVHLIFDKFDELGTGYAVLRYLMRHHILLGRRVQQGPRCGELEWCRPTRDMLSAMFHHPMYAGAYVYGRRTTDHKRAVAGGSKRCLRQVPREAWKVLLRDHLPAYITWERYQANEQRLLANRSLPGSSGTPREGAALLVGLLVCGRCDYHMQSCYQTKNRAYYNCQHHLQEGTEQVCCGLKAAGLDDLVVGQVLRALEPAALELSLQAGDDVQQERARLSQHWKKQAERAHYAAQRAERQYHTVEPENRLVARTLEQRWEEALRQERQSSEDYERFLRDQPAQLTEHERQRIRALAADLPALWQAPGTTTADRKAILRSVVARVVVGVQRHSEYAEVTIEWQGGFTSQHEIVRPVGRYEQLRDFASLVDRIVQLHQGGQRSREIADAVNREGFHRPNGGSFAPENVRQLLCRKGLNKNRILKEPLRSQEWSLNDLARELEMSKAKLRDWIVRGWLHARQTRRCWIAWADDAELERLRTLKERSKRGVSGFPADLITPKERVPRSKP